MNVPWISILLIWTLSQVDELSAARVRYNCPKHKLENGRARVRSRGRVVKYRCYKRFKLYGGSKVNLCNAASNTWKLPPPVCVAAGKKCPPLDVSAELIVTKRLNGGLVKFQCKPGLILKGIKEVYCNGKKWSASPPSCIYGEPEKSCDFERPYLCGWEQDDTDTKGFDWTRASSANIRHTSGTGPSKDHTFKNQTGNYMYIEASYPRNAGNFARLISPFYEPDSEEYCFQFWYHMLGKNGENKVGSLEIGIRNESESLEVNTTVFQISGNQGNKWHLGSIPIGNRTSFFQIIITGRLKDDHRSDIAIDDVGIVQCQNEITTINGETVESSSALPTAHAQTSSRKPTMSPILSTVQPLSSTTIKSWSTIKSTDINVSSTVSTWFPVSKESNKQNQSLSTSSSETIAQSSVAPPTSLPRLGTETTFQNYPTFTKSSKTTAAVSTNYVSTEMESSGSKSSSNAISPSTRTFIAENTSLIPSVITSTVKTTAVPTTPATKIETAKLSNTSPMITSSAVTTTVKKLTTVKTVSQSLKPTTTATKATTNTPVTSEKVDRQTTKINGKSQTSTMTRKVTNPSTEFTPKITSTIKVTSQSTEFKQKITSSTTREKQATTFIKIEPTSTATTSQTTIKPTVKTTSLSFTTTSSSTAVQTPTLSNAESTTITKPSIPSSETSTHVKMTQRKSTQNITPKKTYTKLKTKAIYIQTTNSVASSSSIKYVAPSDKLNNTIDENLFTTPSPPFNDTDIPNVIVRGRQTSDDVTPVKPLMIGLGIGVAIGLVIVIVGTYMWIRRRRIKVEDYDEMTPITKHGSREW